MNNEFPHSERSMPLRLSYQQQTVLDLLKKNVKPDEAPLHDWYIGALHALHNEDNPDRIAQAAQSLRELIEKLPRVVQGIDAQGNSHGGFQEKRRNLHKRYSKDTERYDGEWKGKPIDKDLDKTLRDVGEYLEQNQQPTRKQQMQTAITKLDPMANHFGNTIQKKKTDELHRLWTIFEGFVHHRKAADTDVFKESLEALERILFNLLAPITADDQREIRSILERPYINKNDMERMFSLIERKGSNFAFFFKHATDTTWIPALKERGYFEHPPKVERIDQDRVNYPTWWPIFYLERVSIIDPVLVVNTIIGFQDTNNPSVLQIIAEIALKVEPIEQSLRLKGWVLKYLQSPYQFNVSALIAKLMKRWSDASTTEAVEAALHIMKTVVSFMADPASQDNLHFHEWEYKLILEEGVQSLSEKNPFRAAQILIRATDTMVRLSFHPDQLQKIGSYDLSTHWCPRVNEPISDYQDIKKNLIHTLTFACEKVFEKAPESVAALDSTLRSQRWDIFKRIRQHLYSQYTNEQTKPWIHEMILAHEDYGNREYHSEFQCMLRLACEKFGADLLTMAEKEQIFEAILSGPSKLEFLDWVEEDFAEELFEERKRRFHRWQLRPFAPVLFGQYTDYFRGLETEAEKSITDNDYGLSVESRVKMGHGLSPKSVDELARMSDKALLEYLNNWENVNNDPVEGLVSFPAEELARAFQAVFKMYILPDESRCRFWIENYCRIGRPIHVRAILSAIHEQVKSGQFDRLDQWLVLCEWVLSKPDYPQKKGVNYRHDSIMYPDWQGSHQAVGYFVEMCLSREVNVPITVRTRLSALLGKLCTEYDRQLDENEQPGLSLTGRINDVVSNIRGQALSNLVEFGIWVRRQKTESGANEVFTILDKRLEAGAKPKLTLQEQASLGMNYVRLYQLNQSWAKKYKQVLFPLDKNLPVWTEAFRYFIRYNQPYEPVSELMLGDVNFALENLNGFKITNNDERNNFINKLGYHVYYYYLWGLYPLRGGNSLLELFYQKTTKNPDAWSHLFHQVGQVLSNIEQQLNDVHKERIVQFFDWRLEQQMPSELNTFTYWLQAECLDAEWRLKSYSDILDVCKQESFEIYTQIEAMDTLARLVQAYPAPVVECFDKLISTVVRREDFNYIQTDIAKVILRIGLNSDDATVRETANQTYENLLKHGYSDILDAEN